jgi:hypothetical protein
LEYYGVFSDVYCLYYGSLKIPGLLCNAID